MPHNDQTALLAEPFRERGEVAVTQGVEVGAGRQLVVLAELLLDKWGQPVEIIRRHITNGPGGRITRATCAIPTTRPTGATLPLDNESRACWRMGRG